MMEDLLSDDEKLRFARQIILADFGEAGQIKIKKSRILIVGMGGLGTFSSLLLAEMGVGYLRIVDRDIVEQTNLHRTPLYSVTDLDRAKVEVAGDRLKKLNPSMTIDTHACHVGNTNVHDLLEGIDIVIDALDNFQTRRVINRACVEKGIPFVFCGVSARSGNIAVFNLQKQSPCFSCLYHGIDDNELESCDITGIHPALLPIVTGIQIHEALDILLSGNSSLNSSLLFIDLQKLTFDKIPIQKNPSCSVCSKDTIPVIKPPTTSFQTIEICGEKNFMIVPQMSITLDLSLVKSKLEDHFKILKAGTHAITLSMPNDVILTVFRGGNVLLRGVTHSQSALEIWEELKSTYLSQINFPL